MIQSIVNFWNEHKDLAFSIVVKIITSVFVIMTGLLISRGLARLIKKSSSGKNNLDNTIRSLLRHIVSYGIFIICVIIILNVFNVNTASLVALLGAAGIAVGLALKDTLGNIAAGIILFFLGSYHIGEFIEFGSISGTVKEISLFSTILETPDGIYISTPNASIWGNPLKNFTRNGKRRMELSVRISLTDSIDTAYRVLNDVISNETRFLQDIKPQIIVQSIQESSVNLSLRAWTAIENYWDVYWYQMRNIKEKIEDAGIKIPCPRIQITN